MIDLKSLSLCIFALTLLQLVGAEDTVSSGSYLIHMCKSGQPGSQASKLQSLLPRVYSGLQKVITDLQLGTASPHGYSTFFQDDSSREEILLVYQKMAAGARVVVGEGNLRRPTFICVDDVPDTDLLYQYCMRASNTPFMYWKKTELMPLCPLFWTFKEKATPSDCPLVVANTLTPNDDRLLASQEALLVSVLVHLYHDYGDEKAVRITEASELNASDSLKNPPSYSFYYAGKSLRCSMLVTQQPSLQFPNLTAVQAGCTNFPNMQKPHDELRRLLEVPVNSSYTNTTLSIYSEIPSSMPVPPALDTLQDFCNDAVYAPNATVCCDESTGQWVPAPVIRDGPAAGSVGASCPSGTGGTGGVGAGSGLINTRTRRRVGVY